MDGDENILLEIKDLLVNFYTYQGTVQAIEGIDLLIYKGETLGIVGETGCGKSVTANTIMNLILSPPGKIEAGDIFFMEPNEVRKRRKQYEAEAQDWYARKPLPEKRKLVATYGPRFTGFKKRVKPVTNAQVQKIVPPAKAPNKLLRSYLSNKAKKIPKTDATSRDAALHSYNLLRKSVEYMQKIRGRFISMIFQEPTSALNPVFTAGDQISEVILVHRKGEMAGRALKRIQNEQKAHREGGRPRKVFSKESGTGRQSVACSACRAPAKMEDIWCSKCGVQFYNPLSWSLRNMIQRYNTRMLQLIFKKSDSSVNLLARIPLFNSYKKFLYEEAIRESVRMLDVVRIPDPMGVAMRFPFELSGGMQQRVMIAMALACNPKLLIADEPTTALDVTIQGQILKLMRDLKVEYGSSILLITHNLGVVAEMCDRVGVMYAGSMAEVGVSRVIFKAPMHPYTMGLMKSVPSIQMEAAKLYTIRGMVPNLIYPPSGCRFHPRCDYAKEYCKKVKPELLEIEKGHFVSCHMVSKAEGYVAQ